MGLLKKLASLSEELGDKIHLHMPPSPREAQPHHPSSCWRELSTPPSSSSNSSIDQDMSPPFPVPDAPNHIHSTTSPTRPKHQVTRSISELGVPKSQRHHHGHHHHPHLHRRDKDRDRVREKDEPQSAGPNLQYGMSKSDGESLDVSQRNSMFEIAWDPPKREVKDEEVAAVKEKSVQRATELRNALMNLNTHSNATSLRLDNTYYSVLEKLSVLQNTVSSLSELASMTRSLNSEFQADSEEIVFDVRTQVEGFEGFETQQKKITALQERIGEGRDTIKSLAERVDVVRERVDGWERADWEWQEKTRKRLRVLWTLMSIIAVVMVAMAVFQYTPKNTHGIGDAKMNATLLENIPNFEGMGGLNQTVNRTQRVVDHLERSGRDEERVQDGNEARLRIFDEL